jgi:hypothetical protein
MGFASGFAAGSNMVTRVRGLQQQQKQWEIEEQRRKAEESRRAQEQEWENLDREKKENFEKGDRILRMARQRMAAGQEKEAAALYNQAYKYWPDGNEAMVILPQSQPEVFQQLVQSGQVDPQYADSKLLVVSKQHGVIPFESLQELDKIMGAAFDQTDYLTQLRTREQALAAKNDEATLNPMQAEDGTWMRANYELDPSGIVRFKGYTKYEGDIPMSEKHKALRALGLDPYGLTTEQKEILANLRQKAPSKAQEKLIGKTEQRAEESHEETMAASKQQRGIRGKEEVTKGVQRIAAGLLAGAKEERAEKEEKRKQEKHERDIAGGLEPKERAALYAKAEKAYRESFSDPTGQLKKDAPPKQQWIQDYMNKAVGRTPKATPGGAVGKGQKKVVQEFVDRNTGNRRVVYDDGTQQIMDSKGNVIAERQPIRGLKRK